MAPGFLLTWYHTTASTNLEAFFDCIHGWAHCCHNRILLLHHEEGEACTDSLHIIVQTRRRISQESSMPQNKYINIDFTTTSLV